MHGLTRSSRRVDGGASEDPEANAFIVDFEEVGDSDVVRKVLGDLTAKGLEVTEAGLRKEMERLMAIAGQQITSEA